MDTGPVAKEAVKSGADTIDMHVESVVVGETEQDDEKATRQKDRRILRKIDLRIVPIISMMYIWAFLDRINIGSGVIFGLQEDLKMNNAEYGNVLAIYFVSYTVFELPSNVILKRLKPSVWLTTLMVTFGVISMSQGFVQSYHALLACRFLLGAVEAGVLPGCFYILAMWYKREESQKRFTAYYMITVLAGAFGGLLASAIGTMDGVRGMRGWRWIFIIEGTLTSLCALLCFLVRPDFPQDVAWLSEEDRKYVQQRLAEDVGRAERHEKITVNLILEQFKSFKFILGGVMQVVTTMPIYAYGYFGPTIIKSFGYGNIQTLLHGVPISVVTATIGMTTAYFSDKLRHRYLFAMISLCISFVGYSMLLAIHDQKQTQYGALFLAVAGSMNVVPLFSCWFTMNITGYARRAIATAWFVSAGNVGGIISTYLYKTSDGPRFTVEYATTIGFLGLSALSGSLYYVAVRVENKKRRTHDGEGSGENAIYLYT